MPLQKILDKLRDAFPISLSDLRDSLKGANNKDFSTLEADVESVLARLDITLSALRDALLAEEEVHSDLYGADETVAQSITLDLKGHKLLEVHAEATTATTFTLEYSTDGTHWKTYYSSAAAETKYTNTLWWGYRYARLSLAAAGVAGTDTVDLILSAK